MNWIRLWVNSGKGGHATRLGNYQGILARCDCRKDWRSGASSKTSTHRLGPFNRRRDSWPTP